MLLKGQNIVYLASILKQDQNTWKLIKYIKLILISLYAIQNMHIFSETTFSSNKQNFVKFHQRHYFLVYFYVRPVSVAWSWKDFFLKKLCLFSKQSVSVLLNLLCVLIWYKVVFAFQFYQLSGGGERLCNTLSSCASIEICFVGSVFVYFVVLWSCVWSLFALRSVWSLFALWSCVWSLLLGDPIGLRSSCTIG